MKKIMFFIVAVLMCACDSQEKIQSEVNAALEQYEQFSTECIAEHARENVDKACDAIKKHKKRPDSEIEKKVVENDADLIISKCFDNLFEKYGEKKVIEAIINFVSTKTYKNVEIESKDDFYKLLHNFILVGYLKKYNSNLEYKLLESNLELSRLKVERISRQLGY